MTVRCSITFSRLNTFPKFNQGVTKYLMKVNKTAK